MGQAAQAASSARRGSTTPHCPRPDAQQRFRSVQRAGNGACTTAGRVPVGRGLRPAQCAVRPYGSVQADPITHSLTEHNQCPRAHSCALTSHVTCSGPAQPARHGAGSSLRRRPPAARRSQRELPALVHAVERRRGRQRRLLPGKGRAAAQFVVHRPRRGRRARGSRWVVGAGTLVGGGHGAGQLMLRNVPESAAGLACAAPTLRSAVRIALAKMRQALTQPGGHHHRPD